jgi:hypothetical protein
MPRQEQPVAARRYLASEKMLNTSRRERRV